MSLKNIKEIPQIEVVYGLYNIKTMKWYVGSTLNMHNRMLRHKSMLINNTHHSQKLQNSFNKYGIEVFQVFILQLCENFTIDVLTKTEEFYIKLLDSVQNGYNITDVCKNYYKFSLTDEQIKKSVKSKRIPVIALTLNGEYYKKYNSVSDAAKDLNSQSTNISKACRENKTVKGYVLIYEKDYNPNKDYKYHKLPKTKEHLEKIKNKAKHNVKNRKVYELDNNGNIINTYNSTRELNLQLGLSSEKLRKYYRTSKESKFIYNGKIYVVEESHIKK